MKDKHCARCNIWKNKNDFYKNKKTKDGLRYYCKDCEKLLKKEWHKKNPEYFKQYREDHKDYYKNYFKQYHESHEDIIKKRKKKYYHANREYCKKKSKKYYIENRETILEKTKNDKKWKGTFPKRKDYMKKYYHKKRKKYYKHRYIKNKEDILRQSKEWKKSENGRNSIKKYKSKRYRNFNYIKLWNNPFPDDMKTEDHHYNNWFVIPMPKQTHRYNLGNNHREYNAEWIEKLYSINVDDILGGKI